MIKKIKKIQRIKNKRFKLLSALLCVSAFYGSSTIWVKHNKNKFDEYQKNAFKEIQLKQNANLSLKGQPSLIDKEIEVKIVEEELLNDFKLKTSNNLDKQIVAWFFRNETTPEINKIINNNTKFKYLNYSYLSSIEEIDFFSDYNLNSFSDKQVKIKQMQSIAKFIEAKYRRPQEEAEEIVVHAAVSAKKHNVPFDWVLAVIGVESSYKPESVSFMNAKGLMQVIKKWHPQEVRSLQEQNISTSSIKGQIELGTMVFKKYLNDSKNNFAIALQKYNGNLADKTKRYYGKVFAHRKELVAVKNNGYKIN